MSVDVENDRDEGEDEQDEEDDSWPDRWTIELRSWLYGVEKFKYDSLDEALGGLERLTKGSIEAHSSDGVRRRVAIVIGRHG